jgi:hypothetical protein
MNRLINNTLIAFVILLFVSCSNDKVASYGPPAIYTVVSSTLRTDTLKSGALNNWVLIEGANFVNVTNISFNDAKVRLNDAYITPNEISVRIPRVISQNPTNTITVQTALGSVTYNFKVVYPPLQVFQMDDEFARPGETMAILGKDFDLYGIDSTSSISFGGNKIKLTRAAHDTLFVKVPTGIAAGSEVDILYGSNKVLKVPGFYKDNRKYQINTFDYSYNIQWTNVNCIVGPDTASISGKYFHFTGSITFDYLIDFGPGCGQVPDSVFQNASHYSFKFEVRTYQPMAKTGFQFSFGTSEYNWNPYASGSPLDTKGRWKTVSFPLTNWPFIKGMGQWLYFSLAGGSTPELVDLCLDNFRIVPNN